METNPSIQLDIYINYPGHCEQAFRFYEQQLDGKITMMMPHQQAPANFPTEWKRPIMHAVVGIGGMLVRGADVPMPNPCVALT